ncbi:uncharacterized protein F5147DRAFT_747488 [Suillus discolor]|uniref:Uncharacterized protein n=1 Tax=Suillus discolor TaxID=1912936 RepID=A0A9P7EZI3_9AGAM|nr:uncharacterized protein F5147DRAFT_747488 [Suillus discolor]KAG2097265.1 hypothetical protein F5147DRAFT_747488 [Suillus discolor]
MTTKGTIPNIPSKRGSSALQMGPQKKVSSSDPLVSHGRHFGRMVFALCNYPSLLTNGILRLEQLEDSPLEDFSAEERREHHVFEQLLDSYPGLLERLKDGSEEQILHVGELIGKGATGARGDNTKTLKTKENLRSGEMLVCGDQWPIFLYANHVYDPEDPWCGLLRSRLLIYAYKHVFTSPSSVDREPKATCSGNARLHGMNSVTIASLAYIATQVQFALSSSSVFLWTDTSTDSETFYHSLLDLLEDPEECQEVDELLIWWNRQVLPASSAAKRPISANSALSKIRQQRIALKQATNTHIVSS